MAEEIPGQMTVDECIAEAELDELLVIEFGVEDEE